MYKYVLKRLLWMIPIILGVSFVIFSLINLTPGDPGSIILGGSAEQSQIDAFNESVGYNKPFLVRYINYMAGVLRFDFGTSYVSKQPVGEELLNKISVSFAVALLGITASLFIGVPIGILSAVKQYSILDTATSSVAMLLAAVPSFWVGLMLLLEFSLKIPLFPSFGAEKPGWWVLPMLTLASLHGSSMMRYTRSSMLETIRQDYIRTARAKGVKERIVIMRHALKNALLPVITSAGNTFGALLGGAIVTETLFSLPGLGTFIVNGIKQKDVPVVMGGTITLATMFSFVMLSVDLLYAFADPRIKARYQRKRG